MGLLPNFLSKISGKVFGQGKGTATLEPKNKGYEWFDAEKFAAHLEQKNDRALNGDFNRDVSALFKELKKEEGLVQVEDALVAKRDNLTEMLAQEGLSDAKREQITQERERANKERVIISEEIERIPVEASLIATRLKIYMEVKGEFITQDNIDTLGAVIGRTKDEVERYAIDGEIEELINTVVKSNSEVGFRLLNDPASPGDDQGQFANLIRNRYSKEQLNELLTAMLGEAGERLVVGEDSPENNQRAATLARRVDSVVKSTTASDPDRISDRNKLDLKEIKELLEDRDIDLSSMLKADSTAKDAKDMTPPSKGSGRGAA